MIWKKRYVSFCPIYFWLAINIDLCFKSCPDKTSLCLASIDQILSKYVISVHDIVKKRIYLKIVHTFLFVNQSVLLGKRTKISWYTISEFYVNYIKQSLCDLLHLFKICTVKVVSNNVCCVHYWLKFQSQICLSTNAL